MANNTNYYPPVGFYFGVSIEGFNDTIDAEFQSVSGLSVDIETEEYAEGGENRFKHKLPVRTKFPNLVLKRGLVVKDSSLLKWCNNATKDFQFEKRQIIVSLYTNGDTQTENTSSTKTKTIPFSAPDPHVPNPFRKTKIASEDSKSPAKALMTWTIEGCFPIKWSVDDFNATESKIVVESIELAYNYFTVNNV